MSIHSKFLKTKFKNVFNNMNHMCISSADIYMYHRVSPSFFLI